MKYTIIMSHSARGDWETIDTNKTWAEAWGIQQALKRESPGNTYHIV